MIVLFGYEGRCVNVGVGIGVVVTDFLRFVVV